MSSNVILVTGSYDHNLMFWDATTGQCINTIQYADNKVMHACYFKTIQFSRKFYDLKFRSQTIEVSADKRYLGAATSSQALIYDLPSQKTEPVQRYDGYSNNVTSIGFQKDCKWIYTSSEDGHIKIHDLREQGYQRSYNLKESINTAVLHPNEAEIIAGDQMGNIQIYDLAGCKLRANITPFPGVGIRSISIALNATCMVAGNSAGQCQVYELKNTEDLIPTKTLDAHKDYILKCLISPDVKKLATCSADKTIKLWNYKENEKEFILDKTLYGHSRWVWDCAFSCDTDFLISSSSDMVAKIWKTDSGECIRNLKGHVQALNDVELITE